MQEPTPTRQGGNPGFLTINPVPINHAPIRGNIHLVGPEPSSPFPEIATDPENEHDGQSQIRLEEGLSRRRCTPKRIQRHSELLRSSAVSASLGISSSFTHLGHKDEEY